MSVSDKTYEKFIDALCEIVDDDDGTWEERRKKLIEKLQEEGKEGSLDELLAWFPEGSVEE